jgi:gliding-associated putative ABC transporter substrate-binding component GldG
MINLYSGSSRFISQVEINSAEALLEYQFLKNLDELTRSEKPVVAYATGNGQPETGETYRFRTAIQQRYQFYTYNLETPGAVPGAFNVLVFVKPTLKFTDRQLLKIDQYLMRGGKVIFLMDRLYAEEDSLRLKPETIAFDRDLGLTEFLFRYGVRVNPDLIMDLKCDVSPFIVGGSPDNPQQECLPWNYYPVFESRNNHLINKGLGLTRGKFVNSVDTIAGPQRKTILLASSPNSRSISTPALISLNENKIAPQDEKFNRDAIPAVVLVEGNFISFYRNRLGSADRDSLASWGTPFREESGAEGKLIIAGDGDLVLNDFSLDEDPPAPVGMGWNPYTLAAYRNSGQGNESLQRCAQAFIPYANENFIMNCLEYFTNKPGIIETGNKDIVLRLLDPAKVKDQKTNWQFINIGLPVLLVILCGWIYQQIRKRRYSSYL